MFISFLFLMRETSQWRLLGQSVFHDLKLLSSGFDSFKLWYRVKIGDIECCVIIIILCCLYNHTYVFFFVKLAHRLANFGMDGRGFMKRGSRKIRTSVGDFWGDGECVLGLLVSMERCRCIF